MDLLACSLGEHRFYVTGVSSGESLWCPRCGGALGVALEHIASIPLDARWLDLRSAMVAPEVTVVDVRRKREHTGGATKRIVRDLADYFDVRAHGRSLEVWVNRGAPETAALRVAAVLDGVDTHWEQHFYLPTVDCEESVSELTRPPPPARNHLRLLDPMQNGAEPGSQHA